MEIQEAIKTRHSVRSYMDKAIPEEIAARLLEEIAACNREGGLRIQLVLDEPEAFSGFLAHYGKFSCVKNYIALVGPRSDALDEKAG